MAAFPPDRVKCFTPTTSTGTSVSFGGAVSNLFMTPAESGMVDGVVYDYVLEQGTDFEHNSGAYNAGGNSIARGTPVASKIGGTAGTSKINLNGTAVIYFPFFNRLFEALASADSILSVSLAQAQISGGQNIFVNGGMEIDQQNVGAAKTGIGAGNYFNATLEPIGPFITGAAVLTFQQVSDAPPGLSKSYKASVTTADASVAATDGVILFMPIEGTRIARLAFGTASAQALSIGFWVKANRIGTYSASVQNNAQNRSYAFSFTINASNTWEYKSVTIPGDTTGTWPSDTGRGMNFIVALMQGSNGVGAANTWTAANLSGVTGTINGVAATSDTFQITGIVLIPGNTPPSSANAPSFIRPFADELELCQRYFEKSWDYGSAVGANVAGGASRFWISAIASGQHGSGIPVSFRVKKRAAPTITMYDNLGAAGKAYDRFWGVAGITATIYAGGDGSFTWEMTGSQTTAQQIDAWAQWTADARL